MVPDVPALLVLQGQCLLTESPSGAGEQQLADLHIALRKD